MRAHSEGRLLEAESAYRILLDKSDDPDAAINLGALLRSQRRLQEGSTHYHCCLKRWPHNRSLILNAVNCWRETGENHVSLHWLQHALNEQPGDIELMEALADTLSQAGKTAEAVKLYESVIKTNPKRFQSWMGLGLTNGRVKRFEESKSCFEKVLKIEPKEHRAKANLITIFKETGEFEKANTLINSLDKENSKLPDIRKAIADLKIAEGDNVTASHYLADLASSHPNQAGYWLNWAGCLKGLKFTIAPALILKRGLQFNPDDKNLWLALEQALFEMCNFSAAQRICKLKGLDTNLSNTEQLFNRQFLSLSHGNLIHSAKSDAIWPYVGSLKRNSKYMDHFGQTYYWNQSKEDA